MIYRKLQFVKEIKLKFMSLIILDFTLFVLSKILSPLEVKPKEPNLVDNEFCE